MQFFKDVVEIVAKYYPNLLRGVGYTMLIALTGTVAPRRSPRMALSVCCKRS